MIGYNIKKFCSTHLLDNMLLPARIHSAIPLPSIVSQLVNINPFLWALECIQKDAPYRYNHHLQNAIGFYSYQKYEVIT